MVTVSLCGGTGNQFWQYAFGQALKARGNEVQFDRSYFDTDDTRAYTLDHWNTEVRFGPKVGRAITEPDLLYHPELFRKYDEDVTLAGYWQCPKYLEGVEAQIRKDFTLRESISEPSYKIAQQILQTNSVALHIRRTDSLSERGLAFHGVLSPDYYHRAVEHLVYQLGNPTFFVFSDDIEWCKKNIDVLGAVFVDCNSTGVEETPEHEVRKTDTGREHEDLWLMSRCKHHIIANSSFGWWGAWLRENPHTVVAPKQWFVGRHNRLSADMIPPEWTKDSDAVLVDYSNG